MPLKPNPAHLEVLVPAESVQLPGSLDIPPDASGVVAFAHGSGSSRHSVRNRYVASVLRESGLATLLFDLLTEGEATDRRNVFDIRLLAERLLAAARWLMASPQCEHLSIGLFGASTGAAAALIAAADEGRIGAVVSRGGRPDLAGPWLKAVRAPTLLIVGGDDPAVLDLNRGALDALRCEKRLEVIEGATHLFEEPGTLEAAAALAAGWFAHHLSGAHAT